MDNSLSPAGKARVSLPAVISLLAGLLGSLLTCLTPLLLTVSAVSFSEPVKASNWSVAFFVTLGLGILLILVALVGGIVGLVQVRRSLGARKGKGLAIAGIVLGALGLALPCLVLVLAVVGPLASGNIYIQ